MRGILWRWIFFFGIIFWISLCTFDYYLKNFKKQKLQDMEVAYRQEELNRTHHKLVGKTKSPPALTFWKTLSMILSVSALVYIKRSSSFKKNARTSVMITLPKSHHNSSTELYRDLTVLPARISYYKDLRDKQLLSEICTKSSQKFAIEANSNKSNSQLSAVNVVEIVQKKLEDLEKSVASLKKRRNTPPSENLSTAPSRLVSNSPAFQKFLASNPPISNKSNTSMVFSSQHFINDARIPGGDLVSTSESTLQAQPLKMSSESLIKKQLTDILDNEDVNSSLDSFKTSASSSEISFGKVMKSSANILEKSTSKLSFESGKKSLESMLTQESTSSNSAVSEEGDHVPGSNLVSTSDCTVSEHSTSMLTSSSSFPRCGGDSSFPTDLLSGDEFLDDLD